MVLDTVTDNVSVDICNYLRSEIKIFIQSQCRTDTLHYVCLVLTRAEAGQCLGSSELGQILTREQEQNCWWVCLLFHNNIKSVFVQVSTYHH